MPQNQNDDCNAEWLGVQRSWYHDTEEWNDDEEGRFNPVRRDYEKMTEIEIDASLGVMPTWPSAMQERTITIEIGGGVLTGVTGLPEGWNYVLIDHDTWDDEQWQLSPLP